MDKNIIIGAMTALITPFKNGKVDEQSYARLIKRQIENGIDAVVPVGTTGESATLTHEEHRTCIEIAVETCKGTKVKVLAGAGSNATHEAVGLAKFAKEHGADGILSVAPYYNKPTQQGLYEHYKAIAQSVDIPVLLYNVPGRTGVNLSINLVEELSKLENVVAIKEASGNISYAAEIARVVPELDIYSGNDDMTVPLLSIGGKGVISVSANILPEIVHNMVMAFLNKDIDKARELQLKYNDLVNALFIEVNPVPIKEAMNFLGYDVGGCRLPLGEMSEKNKEILYEVIRKHEVSEWK